MSVIGHIGDDVDVLLTGEMSHHEVLAANAEGKHVILSDHSNTERGYLPVLQVNTGGGAWPLLCSHC